MTAAQTIDLLAPDTPARLVLLAARIGGVVLVAPVFSARAIPVTMRTALIVLLTIVLFPAARLATGAGELTPVAVLGETLVGLVVGLGAALIIGAAVVTGEFISLQIGLSGAALLDPLSQHQVSALGVFFQLLALTLLLTMNGHLVMLDALAVTTQRVPIGAALSMEPGLAAAVSEGSALFVLGLRFAAPVIAVALVANVALAVLSRAAPQLNILQIAFPVHILAGLVALFAVLPAIGAWFFGWESVYGDMLTRMFGAFASAGVR